METELNAHRVYAAASNGSPAEAFAIQDSSGVASARRGALGLAGQLGFGETAAGALALIATEAATNILYHAGEGELLVNAVCHGDTVGVEIIAIDRGPGIADLAASMQDGVSTRGGAGTGLGAMRRLSHHFDVYSRPGQGSVFALTLWADAAAGQRAQPLQYGAVCVAKPGENVSGDAWYAAFRRGGAHVLVVDGIGHGPDAAAAARAALATFEADPEQAPARQLESLHLGLQRTRGAALAVLALDITGGRLQFAGVGNVAATLYGHERRRQLVSHNGIVGHNLRKVQEFTEVWPAQGLLILHSDGLATHWDLDTYPGLAARHPSVIAGVLYRDHARRRDDVTVLVLRATPAARAMG